MAISHSTTPNDLQREIRQHIQVIYCGILCDALSASTVNVYFNHRSSTHILLLLRNKLYFEEPILHHRSKFERNYIHYVSD